MTKPRPQLESSRVELNLIESSQHRLVLEQSFIPARSLPPLDCRHLGQVRDGCPTISVNWQSTIALGELIEIVANVRCQAAPRKLRRPIWIPAASDR